MIAALLMTLAAAPNPWATPRFAAFGDANDWVAVNVASKAVTRLSLPTPASDVALSSDATLVAFVGDGAEGRVLVPWDMRASASPRQISTGLGYVGDPVFSSAGDELYFDGNADNGPPGAHAGKSYSQIFRAHAPEWKQEQLTKGRGCHFAPIPSSKGWGWLHTWCMGQKWLELKQKEAAPEVRLPPADSDYRELAGSPDGKRVLLVSHGMTSAGFDEVVAGEWRLKLICERTRSQPKARAAWWANASEILFEDDGWIWVHDARGERQLASIKGAL